MEPAIIDATHDIGTVAGFAAASAEAFALARQLCKREPFLAGALIHQLYYAPAYQRLRHRRRSDMPERARAFLDAADQIDVARARGRVRAYRWGDAGAPAVLLVHGWTSRASDWLLPARVLRQAGLTLVAYDHPAHGESDGMITSLPDCVDALRHVLAAVGAVETIVAHSGGGAIVATALGGLLAAAPAPPQRLALLAPPASLRATMDRFAARHRLSGAAIAHFEARIVLENGLPTDAFAVGDVLRGLSASLLHIVGSQDEEIPAAESAALREALLHARRLDVDADHAGLLTSRTVARALVAFALDPAAGTGG